jgi:uncharacterized repeat protein (TIGR03837 family)
MPDAPPQSLSSPLPLPLPSPLHWDLFCRVIDNFGDIGVCWRLARQLAAAGDAVRLFVDDASALRWMAPAGAAGVTVVPWPSGHTAPPLESVGDVVIEAFGCDLPPPFVQAMRARSRPALWVNLEYLSAEDYVERSHGLPSPQADGQIKRFFYPGFTARTGGLLREAQQQAFQPHAWLQQHGAVPRPAERVVSLFCYDNPGLPALLAGLAERPTLLLLTPGPAQQQVTPSLLSRWPLLRAVALPWLTQTEFDPLLWACELNCVRGEDSLVRALWAGTPFLWQAYPQSDGVHSAKIEALAAQLNLPEPVRAAWRAWNGLAPEMALPNAARGSPWALAAMQARTGLLAQDDLATQLRAWALASRP